MASQQGQLKEGDTVHVVRHGPAVLEGIGSQNGDQYKVRYPDGSCGNVNREDILVHQPQFQRSASNGSSGQGMLVSPSSPRQVVYLGRAFDDAGRSISTPSAIFSLVATMVGGGVLSLPYAMSQSGLLLGTLALLLAAAMSTWTLDMLIECARRTGSDAFELLGHAAFSTPGARSCMRKATVGLIFMLCWLSLIAYFVLLGDLLVPSVELALPHLENALHGATPLRRAVTLGAAVLLAPMCFKSKLSTLRFLCFASVGSVLFVGTVVLMRAAEEWRKTHSVAVTVDSQPASCLVEAGLYRLWPADWWAALHAFPVFGVAFLCHFNALPTHQELQRPTLARIRRVLVITMGFTSALYFLIGASGYLHAGSCTCGNILLNFHRDDTLVACARVALGVVLMLNFPLIVQPCRNALFRLLQSGGCFAVPSVSPSSSEVVSQRAVEFSLSTDSDDGRALNLADVQLSSGSPEPPAAEQARVHVYRRGDVRGRAAPGSTLEAFDTFAPKDETVQQSAAEPSPRQRCILTVGVLGTSLGISLFMQSIMVVWSVIGSTVAFAVAFLLPGVFWLRIVGASTKPLRRRLAVALVAVTCVLAVVCTVLTCMNLNLPPCPDNRHPSQARHDVIRRVITSLWLGIVA